MKWLAKLLGLEDQTSLISRRTQYGYEVRSDGEKTHIRIIDQQKYLQRLKKARKQGLHDS